MKIEMSNTTAPKEDIIVGVYTACPNCSFKVQNYFVGGKTLISEFLEDLKTPAGMSDYDRFALLVDLRAKWEGRKNE